MGKHARANVDETSRFALTLDTVTKMTRDALAYLQVGRFVRRTDTVMNNARSPSQILVECQISVEHDPSNFCNTASAQARTLKIQAVRTTMQKHWNKQNVTSQVQLLLRSLARRLVVVENHTCKCRL